MKFFGKDKKKEENLAPTPSIIGNASSFFGGGKQANAPVEETKEVPKEKQIVKITPGDYTIHVFVEKFKDLAIAENTTTTVVAEVKCAREKKFSGEYSDQSSTSETTMNDHIFVEKKNQTVEQLQDLKVTVSLLAKGAWKNTVIGAFEFDFQYIYFMEDHAMLHQWVAMCNPNSEDFSQVAGLLKLSVSIHGAQDTPVLLAEDTNDDTDEVMMPSVIKARFQQLKIHFFKAEHLPKMDSSVIGEGKTDAYFITENSRGSIKTQVVTTANDQASWFETMLIPVRTPFAGSNLIIKLFDWDASGDEIVGSLFFPYKEIFERPSGEIFWVNIYGPQGGDEGNLLRAAAAGLKGRGQEYYDMCHNPTIANQWKGRVLIGIEYSECDQPLFTTVPIEDARLRSRAVKAMEMQCFTFQIYAQSVICTPADSQEYYLELQMADQKWKTSRPRIVGHNFCRWQQKSEQTDFYLPCQSIEEIGVVFLYLCNDKGERISFAKFPAVKFAEHNAKLEWIEFTPDPVLKSIKSPELGGICSFRLSISKGRKQDVNFNTQPNWSRPETKRPPVNKVRAFIYQARDLPAADDDGVSDPLIRVFDHWQLVDKRDKPLETKVVNNTLWPMFYECIELVIEGKIGELPPFVVDCYDVDKKLIGSDTKDFMCRSIIQVDDAACSIVNEASDDTGFPPEPKWHKCYFKQGQQPCGEILVSFIINTEFDLKWKVPHNKIKMMGIAHNPADRDALVQFDEFNVEINVLGLRSLKSSGLLPVKKAYIQFGLKTLVPPIVGATIDNVQTTPGPSGPDPTINTIVSFRMLLPENPKYAPAMACRVYDKIFTGFDGQLVGVFTIPVGQILQDQRSEFAREEQELKNLVQRLVLARDGKAVPRYTAVKKQDLTMDDQFKQIIQSEKSELRKVFDSNKVSRDTSRRAAIKKEKGSDLTKSLLAGEDEDSDEEGNTFKRPVGVENSTPYQPPAFDFSLNQSIADETRASISQTTEQTALAEAIHTEVTKPINTLPKDVDPEDRTIYKPMASPRVSKKALDNSLKESMGLNVNDNLSSPMAPGNIQMLDANKSKVQFQIQEEIQIQTEKIKRLDEKETQISMEKFLAEDPRAFQLVISPTYEFDERLKVFVEVESKIPPVELFEPLGWDREQNPDEKNKAKHYRRFYKQELENVKEVMSSPSEFNRYTLYRGQVRGAQSSLIGKLFSSSKIDMNTGEESTQQEVGMFKGLIQVSRVQETEIHELNVQTMLASVYQLLCEIHEKMFAQPFPFKDNVFGWKQSEARHREGSMHSSSVESGEEEEMIETKIETRQRILRAPTMGLNKKKKDEDLTVLDAQGRVKFRQTMVKMGLGELKIAKVVMDLAGNEIMKRMLLTKRKCVVRTYLIGCFNLAARDNDSPSDPYVVMKLGNQEFNDRENYIEDEPNPTIHKKVDFEGYFPGCPQLKIAMWDYDLLFGDDLIGETVIDLEDRYFSADWNTFVNKPIEFRKLYHPSSQIDQGTVKLWLEILPTSQDLNTFKEWDISPKPAEEFEVRVIVYESEELKMMDVEGTTDGFVKTFFDPEHAKETDTHFRNQNGMCSWNYRMLHTFKHPNKNYKLTVQAFDRDLFTKNDLIGEIALNLKPLIQDASLMKAGVCLNKKYYEEYLKIKFPNFPELRFERDGQTFWVELQAKVDGKIEVGGKLRLQIDVLPKFEAEKNKVGEAQSEPNVNPYLPKPEGRMHLSLNPFEMIRQLVGPQFRRYGYAICFTILCVILIIMLLPMIFSEIITQILLPPY